jgi:hypothetical protein
VSFLGHADVEARLDALSAVPKLTIFVGAGTSMEVGLPSWSTLLDCLLRQAAEHNHLGDEAAEAFVDSAWNDGMGVLGVGSIVRAALGAAPDSYIRKALYETGSKSAKIATQLPGPSALRLAELVPLWPRGGVEIVTTNYDLLLEEALREVFARRVDAGLASFAHDDSSHAPVSDVRPGADEGLIDASGTMRVRHLHGALGRKKGPDDRLPAVLGEHDFYDVMSPGTWQLDWFSRRLAEAPCLFVGASMNDANVLRFLHASATGNPLHTALISGTRDPLPAGPAADLWQDTTTKRWADFDVTALYPRYYADTAAFLDELGRRRRRRLDKQKLLASDRRPARLQKWHAQISKTVLPLKGPKFAVAQDAMTTALTAYLADAKDLLLGSPKVADCHYGLQLWIPDDAGTKLVMWGSSQHAWRDPETLSPLPIQPRSKWISIETWCQGTPTLMDFTSSHGTRWESALGIPITLTRPPFDGLQVAVATFNVMGKHAVGLLGSLPPDDLQAVVGFLQDGFADLLDPSVTP